MLMVRFFFFFKQKAAYEMRISDWSSDVCSSDLAGPDRLSARLHRAADAAGAVGEPRIGAGRGRALPAGGAASTAWRAARSEPAGGVEIGRASCRERVCQYV